MASTSKVVDTRVRIPRILYDQIKALAERERRSINSQMVVMLERAMREGEAKDGATNATKQ